MPDYSDLDQSFEAQLARTARFVRAAFHVHSVDSFDWGKEADADRNDAAQFAGPAGQDLFLDRLVAAGLELVCITDHMKADYACALAARAAQRDDITVFPGMEISCLVPPGHREAIHVLVVFPPTATPDVIDRLFADNPAFPGAPDRDGREQAIFPSLSVVRDRVDGANGLFVLAHIDQVPRGHRCYVRSVRGETAQMFAIDPGQPGAVTTISNEYAEHLVGLDPHAVEVMKSDDRAHYFEFTTTDARSHRFACVARSDHHSIEALDRADAVTYLKVSRRDIGCVRDALHFFETRVRFADDLPTSPSPRLVGIRVRGGGLFTDATIALNENLNCLIGPRGCGKSTLVEALRYVLGQRPLLDDASTSLGDDRSYASLAIATQQANLADSEIELIYEQDGARHVLSATYDPDRDITTRVFGLDGEDRHVAQDALESAYPARIFSWSELETLGRQPRLQRLVVDRLSDDLPSLQDAQRRHLTELQNNRASILSLRATLDSLLTQENGALLRYAEYQTAYQQLNTPTVRTLFAQLDSTREKIEALEAVDTHLRAVEEQVRQITRQGVVDQIDAFIADQSADLRAWWAEEPAPTLDLPELTRHIDEHTDAIGEAVRKRREFIAGQLEQEKTAAEAHEATLREKTHSSPDQSVRRDQREQARQRLEAASALRDRYLAAFSELEAALTYRGQLLGDLASGADDITSVRQQIADDLGHRLAEIQQDGPAITIIVEPGGDRASYISHLEDFLNLDRGGHYRAQGIPERLSTVAPTVLVHAILTKAGTELAGEGQLTTSEAERLVQAFDVFPDDEAAAVTRVDPSLDELLVLQEQRVEDLVRIESDGRSVDRLSPGGRSSAMLPLIALSDHVPLIIDQPEDNLDNRMVGQTLSSILSKLKEHRQIIVTTHNPNIVVGGDAEQVVVLDAPDAESARVESTGSIDDPAIIDAVIKIMEGGREAFEERRRRYKDRLS